MLNDKQKLFIQHYLIDPNATQAAIKAGYSEKTAYSQGQRLLKHVEVADQLSKKRAKLEDKMAITAENVLRGFARIAFHDPRKIIKDGQLIPVEDWDDDTALAMDSVELVTKSAGKGEVEYVAKVKQSSRSGALKSLADHLGIATRQLMLIGDPDQPLTLDATDRAGRIAALLAKAVQAQEKD
jgi:phage terminase small subunit